MEILDHFACKVEELGTLHPDWPLQKRMTEAHLSFGIGGFYPMVRSYSEQLEGQYKRYFRRALLRTVTSASGIGLMLMVGLLFYALTLVTVPLWQRMTGEISFEPAFWMVFLIFAGVDIYQIRLFPKRGNILMRAARDASYPVLFVLYLGGCVLPEQVPLAAIACVVSVITATALQQARYATLRAARADYETKMQVWQAAG